MGRYAQDTGGGEFQQAPAGTHIARAIKIIDLGTQHGEYQGQPTVRNQVVISWELPNELMTIDGEEKPMIVSKFYTNSLSEKANLRRDLESWRSRPFTTEELMRFDLMKILGAPAMVTVIHNEKGKARVMGVAALPKGTKAPEPYNAPEAFWLDEWDAAKFEALSEGFKRIIAESDEYKAMFTPPGERAGKAAAAERQPAMAEDDIPFVLNECVFDSGDKLARRLARTR